MTPYQDAAIILRKPSVMSMLAEEKTFRRPSSTETLLPNLINPSLLHALLTGYEEIKLLLPEKRALIRALFAFPREAWIAAFILR